MFMHSLFVPGTGGFVLIGMPGHSPDIGLTYDSQQAHQLLADAGYPGGTGLPIIDCWMSSAQASSGLVEYVCSQWEQILGVKMRIERTRLIYDRIKEDPPPKSFSWAGLPTIPTRIISCALTTPANI
jgi:ABC-type transport system substrate-binding protein